MQVLADLARLPIVGTVEGRAERLLAAGSGPGVDAASRAIKDALAGLERAAADPTQYGAAHVRRHLDTLVAGFEVALLAGSGYDAASELFAFLRLDPARRPDSETTLGHLTDAVLS